MKTSSNPWRTGVIVTAIAIAVMFALGAGAYALRKSPPLRAATSSGTARQAQRAVVEDCNQYAAQARRDTGRIVRDGAVGGAVGAGVGAAGGAIADGGEGAGQGAGIGAPGRATIRALRGFGEGNQKAQTPRSAYTGLPSRPGYQGG